MTVSSSSPAVAWSMAAASRERFVPKASSMAGTETSAAEAIVRMDVAL
jgi:hypothetical protein